MTIRAAHNTGFASGGVTCKLGALYFYSSSVQVNSFGLRNPPERKARNRTLNADRMPGSLYLKEVKNAVGCFSTIDKPVAR